MVPRFRAWHKELKEMFFFDFETLRCICDGDSSMIALDDTGDVRLTDSALIIMQWTGFCDVIAEKDIYENDIMETNYGGEPPDQYGIVKQLDGGTWIVEFKNGFTDLYDADMTLNLVGNIYENPELLNADS